MATAEVGVNHAPIPLIAVTGEQVFGQFMVTLRVKLCDPDSLHEEITRLVLGTLERISQIATRLTVSERAAASEPRARLRAAGASARSRRSFSGGGNGPPSREALRRGLAVA